MTKIAADTPAKAGLLNMILHNGKFGCPSCETPGTTTKKGRGHNRSYHFSLVHTSNRRSKASMRRQGTKADATRTVSRIWLAWFMYILFWRNLFHFMTSVIIIADCWYERLTTRWHSPLFWLRHGSCHRRHALRLWGYYTQADKILDKREDTE